MYAVTIGNAIRVDGFRPLPIIFSQVRNKAS